MSIAEIERFAADLESNKALRGEAEKAEAETSHTTPVDRVIAFAATKGYAFTADDMKDYIKARAHAAATELTDARLGGIVGGTTFYSRSEAQTAATRDLPDVATFGESVTSALAKLV